MSEKEITIIAQEYILLCHINSCAWDHFQATHDPAFRKYVGGPEKQVKPLHDAVKAYADWGRENEGD